MVVDSDVVPKLPDKQVSEFFSKCKLRIHVHVSLDCTCCHCTVSSFEVRVSELF